MLNNEAGQNYVVLACKLWGIPRLVCSSEGSKLSGSGWIGKWGAAGGGAEYENGINVPIPKGVLQHGKPFGFALLRSSLRETDVFIASW